MEFTIRDVWRTQSTKECFLSGITSDFIPGMKKGMKNPCSAHAEQGLNTIVENR